MSIKEKISNNHYHIYVEGRPDSVTQFIHLGDYYTFTLVGFNYDDSPFDFGVYDEFNSQVRLITPYNSTVFYEFPDSAFVLGKSELNLDVFDELHVTDADLTQNLSPYLNKAYMDIEGVLNTPDNKERKTFITIEMNIEVDITR